MCNVQDTIIETFSPIPFVDEDSPLSINQTNAIESNIKTDLETSNKAENDSIPVKNENSSINLVEVVKPLERKYLQGTKVKKLDKSYSAPTYDDDNSDENVNGEYKTRLRKFI